MSRIFGFWVLGFEGGEWRPVVAVRHHFLGLCQSLGGGHLPRQSARWHHVSVRCIWRVVGGRFWNLSPAVADARWPSPVRPAGTGGEANSREFGCSGYSGENNTQASCLCPGGCNSHGTGDHSSAFLHFDHFDNTSAALNSAPPRRAGAATDRVRGQWRTAPHPPPFTPPPIPLSQWEGGLPALLTQHTRQGRRRGRQLRSAWHRATGRMMKGGAGKGKGGSGRTTPLRVQVQVQVQVRVQVCG